MSSRKRYSLPYRVSELAPDSMVVFHLFLNSKPEVLESKQDDTQRIHFLQGLPFWSHHDPFVWNDVFQV